jgi:signal transduction histidine kinase
MRMELVALPMYHRLPRGHATELPDARRSDSSRLARDVQIAVRSPVVATLLQAVDSILLVLNDRREIVAHNAAAAHAAGRPDLRGLRPGEALDCMNAHSGAGCGTAPACETCGALGAILAAQRNRRSTEAECLIRSTASSALELNVRATPVVLDGAEFTVVSLRDLSAEKRRDAFEQVFLHDVLNTVGGLRGWAMLLRAGKCDVARASDRIEFLTRQVEREIRDHRDLVLAEAGSLVPEPRRVACADAWKDVEAIFSSHPAARGRTLLAEVSPPDLALDVDAGLLLRVLVNMVRNALEATAPGGSVRLRATSEASGPTGEGVVRFSVHNDGAMTLEVQHRVFVRSFTTKDERGHGLGTYGMKLLGERFLGGKVSFASTPESGTTFFLELPARPAT